MYKLVLLLSVDHQALWTHLCFQLLQCSHRLLDALANLSSHGICTDAAPQDPNRQRTANQTRTPGTDVARTASLAPHFETCRCFFLELLAVRVKLEQPSLDIVDMAHWGHLPLINTSQSTILRTIIQIESDDTVASSMNNDTTQMFDREDTACVVQRERFSASVQSASHCSLGIPKSSLHNRREVTTLLPFSSNTSWVRVTRMMICVHFHEHQSLRDRPQSKSSYNAGQ